MIPFSQYLEEGVNDPSIFKVVFLAGGPGSGKSFMVKKAALKALGFVIINSDEAFEHLMKKSGLDFKMPDSEQAQRDIVRSSAKATAGKKEELAIQGRLGMVIDGTGKDYDKINKMRANLSVKGYDAAMVFVNTDLETALSRNAKRQRSVPEEMAKKLWKQVQNNLGKFQQSFGRNFHIIDNSDGADYESQTNNVFKKISAWSKESPKNGVAKKWIEQQRTRKEEVELGEKYSPDLEVSQQQLNDLEKFGDRLLKKFGLDVEFTKHFGDRMADDRNNPPVKVSEIQSLFKKIAKDKGRKVSAHKDHEAVLNDLQSDLNLPFVLKPKGGELELVMKTIMRKKDFKSPDPKVTYEEHGAGEWGTDKLTKKYKKDTPGEDVKEDSGSIQHHQYQKSFKHAMQHATTHIDKDVDSDVDELDKTTPDEISGDPDQTKKMLAKYSKEKKHTRKGLAFEDFVAEGENKQMKGKDPCWKGYEMIGTKKKGDKTVPNCVPKESVAVPLYVQEAAYDGNIGMMELAKFYMKATPAEKTQLQDHIKNKRFKEAWKMVEKITGVKLKGKEFATEELTNEDGTWFSRAIGKAANYKAYKDASDTLKKVWDRKKVDKKHDINYYAAQIARQYSGVDARKLVSMVEELTTEDSITTTSSAKKPENYKKPDGKIGTRMVPIAKNVETESVEEEVAANSVAGGGVDMNPTGKPKWDKRSKFHIDHMFRRADGTKYKKKEQK